MEQETNPAGSEGKTSAPGTTTPPPPPPPSNSVLPPENSGNPNGQSKGGASKVLLIIGTIVLVGFILAAVAFFALFNSVKNKIEDEIDTGSLDEINFGIDDTLDSDNLDRDAQIVEVLAQYQVVVDATGEDVSWEEYFVELDTFIDELEKLSVKDPNPLLDESLALFRESRQLYEDAVQIDDPDAEIDEDGVAEGGVVIGEAQDKVNAYLEEINY